MSSIFDYLEWRGDISFDVDPFNEVDNLVLSELAYTCFDGTVPYDGEAVPLSEVRNAYFRKHPRSAIREDSDHIAKAPLLMDGMVSGKRFADTFLTGYVDIVDRDEAVQMAAVTILLGDGSAFIAFRGTDGTIAGWKEDFRMSYLQETEGQRRAVWYLNETGKRVKRPLRLGGHSKGGNFAVYASAFCDKRIRKRIKGVYTNDGPGFRPEVMATDEYRSILPLVTSIVPDTSVIGMLLTSDVAHRFVKSEASVIAQHDPLTWEVMRNSFVESKPSDLGLFIKNSQKGWLRKLDDRERELFVDTLFSILEAAGVHSLEQLGEKKLKALSDIRSSMKEIPKDKQKEMNRIIAELLHSSSEAAREMLTKKHTNP